MLHIQVKTVFLHTVNAQCVKCDVKTLCHSLLPDKMTYLGQKFCVVVYPAEGDGGSSGSGEGEEMKEARSPLSKEDGDNHKSADC